LLLLLVATGSAGLQLQTIIMRWHEHAVLEALGFTPLWLLGYSCLRVLLIFTIGIAIAGVVSLSLPSMLSGSLASFATASGLLTAASLSVTVPVLFWALRAPPGERLRELR
jgi:predicted lysophospholipase L1 biosynthesis ABC-type transport system permease subunit